MTTPSGIRVVDARVFFLPVVTRMPLKFGGQTVTSVTCAGRDHGGGCRRQAGDRLG